MTGRFLLIAACLLASACSRDWDGRDARAPSFSASASQSSSGAMIPPSSAAPSIASRASGGFAALPDRGDLTAYPEKAARRDGAYTWHRADISEQHALRAIVDGTLNVTAPSGDVLRFAYERHVEHPSGDWTWFGRLERGDASDEAIITFGERAVFGSIAQPGREPLKLTIRDGAAWIVETDRAALRNIVNAATRPRGPDYLVPPDLAPRKSGDGRTMASAAPVMASSTPPAGTTVIDLVLGYTSGFAAGLGGTSAAVTRLNFMVDVVNQSYVNSQVPAQVRLVHTLQVSYPDATANNTTLEDLTGYRSGTGFITPNPAFDALRAARDQYGADLVSLVRKFSDPENDGCGIAWLIGAAQSGIDANDEPFGYSVVADGTDVGTDGKTYFCREETLAHEMGHNMGSQHDRDTAKGTDGVLDAKDYGVFPYSFGYKTTGASNFYTIMAYGDPGQTRYRVFSNPNITFCGGAACGVNNQADNALSLSQTTPIVAKFRTTVVPLEPTPAPTKATNDVNGDGKSDIVWRSLALQQVGRWYMNGAVRIGASPPDSMPGGYRIVGLGDFDGDGRSDLLWSDGADSHLVMWLNRAGNQYQGSFVDSIPPGWTVAGVIDLNADGKADIVWRNAASGQVARWYMSGSVRIGGAVPVDMPSNWRIIGMADFDADSRGDLLWADSSNSHLVLWLSTSTGQFEGRYVSGIPAGWSVAGVVDLNGDQKSDIVWRSESLQQVSRWYMSGAVLIGGAAPASMSSGYRIVATRDYDGDGRGDLLWTNAASDHLILWRTAADGQFEGSFVDTYPSGWVPM